MSSLSFEPTLGTRNHGTCQGYASSRWIDYCYPNIWIGEYHACVALWGE